jgi:hypothetical protein
LVAVAVDVLPLPLFMRCAVLLLLLRGAAASLNALPPLSRMYM